MGMLKISLPDGLLHEYASGITVGEIVRNAYGKKSGAVAALVNGEERDFSYVLEQDCDIEPILGESEAGRYILRHSCAHLLAQAVVETVSYTHLRAHET